jgi:hypothetical protein
MSAFPFSYLTVKGERKEKMGKIRKSNWGDWIWSKYIVYIYGNVTMKSISMYNLTDVNKKPLKKYICNTYVYTWIYIYMYVGMYIILHIYLKSSTNQFKASIFLSHATIG